MHFQSSIAQEAAVSILGFVVLLSYLATLLYSPPLEPMELKGGVHGTGVTVELTENLELPVTLLENHNPWPAYVMYTSPAVKRLIDKSRARDLECIHSYEETFKPTRLSKCSFTHLKGKKSSKSSELMLKDALSESRQSTWEPCSATNMSSTLFPEPTQSQMEAREGPTSNYNKIIFSRRPAMRKLPYDLLQASKEPHAKA
ncbi:CMT1A duplicated region transcript 4 protein [Microtus oregoni]|uniref:CMT1A duplicated region transcript 4 protein n=1 Tax=Microtus oregoni TaxID=111838 RepID=UPI001BB294C6|nr:CMT1A duplicated region transcript 4 protein [Microtus oregoni]